MSVMQQEPTDLTPLSEAEAADLAHCEEVIGRGLQTFYETGAALATIRDTHLYRATHATFADYCRDRWSIARQTAYQLISAAGVVENVRNCGQTLPANEAQARPLAALPAADQPRAWQAAVAATPDGKPSAAQVTEAVKQFKRPASPVSLVPDAIIDPPAQPLPPSVMGMIRSPEQVMYARRKEFSDVTGPLFSACVAAQRHGLIQSFTPEEMAEMVAEDVLDNARHITPTLEWVLAVFAARRNTPAIRRIK